MHNFSQTTISDEELNSIIYALMSRYALDFSDYEPTSLKRRLVRIMHKNNLQNVLELWQKLLYNPEFASILKDEISVGLTEMFRNPGVWTFIKNDYLNKFSTKDAISIWHAGCSTGEEYYTMCIVLKEAGMLQKSSVVVTDLNDNFIKITKKGEYDLELLTKYQINYKKFNNITPFSLYYQKNDEFGIFNENIKPKTEFLQHNLVSDSMNKQFDIIFCRNVMIYFNESLKTKVLQLFYNCLKKDGILVIGHFDALPTNYNQKFSYYSPSQKIFIKNDL